MALKRTPSATQANGVAMLVKAGSTGLFSNFQRVPGLANFTLPDETGSTNETQLLDGSVSFAQIAGVGTITGNIGAITAHPTHQWLAARRRAGDQITVTIIRPASAVLDEVAANVSHPAGASGTDTILTFTGNEANSILEGQLVAVGASTDDLEAYIGYEETPVAGDDHKFRSVLAVDPDTKKVKVAPRIVTALAGNATNRYSVRNAGLIYENILCTVNGFGDGDFQAGSAASANISFAPVSVLERGVEHRILSEFTTEFDSAFAGLT